MIPEYIFKYRYEQLVRILKERKISKLLDLSQILRQFLIDSPSIINQINRKHRIKIRFDYPGSTEELLDLLQVLPDFIWIGDRPPKLDVQSIAIDRYLKTNILYVQGIHYSVKQVIKACANKLGGVHFDSNIQNDPDASAFEHLNKTYFIGGAPSIFRLLHPIGTTTEKALNDLYNKIIEQDCIVTD